MAVCPSAAWVPTNGDNACHCFQSILSNGAVWGGVGILCTELDKEATLATGNTAADKAAMIAATVSENSRKNPQKETTVDKDK